MINLEFNIKRPGQGKVKFCYTDTDSIYFDLWEPLLHEFKDKPEEALLKEFHSAWLLLSDHFKQNCELSEIHQILCQKVKEIFIRSDVYKLLNQIEIFDPCDFANFRSGFKMIDQSKLGGFKIERICFGGVFTAPKQYTLLQVDMESRDQRVLPMFKGKGVKKSSL